MAEISVFNANQLVFLDETGIVCTKQYLTVTGLHKLLDFLFIWLYVLRTTKLLGNMDTVLVGCRLLLLTIAMHVGHLAILLVRRYRVRDLLRTVC